MKDVYQVLLKHLMNERLDREIVLILEELHMLILQKWEKPAEYGLGLGNGFLSPIYNRYR